jgi:hypothetical protein
MLDVERIRVASTAVKTVRSSATSLPGLASTAAPRASRRFAQVAGETRLAVFAVVNDVESDLRPVLR